jgi:hydrogenase nickel incorporation protein HypA/HybF
MHELAIVEALIDQVGQELDRAGQPGRVLRVELSIGRLSGVLGESVRFAFGLLTPGTRVEGAELVIREPKAVCNCRACPRCASTDIIIEGGRDLLLQSIEIEE